MNLNFGNNNNLVTNLNQNVGNNFNLMFPPGKKRRRRRSPRTGRAPRQEMVAMEELAKREEEEMVEVWGNLGKGATCKLVEVETAWNLLKASI